MNAKKSSFWFKLIKQLLKELIRICYLLQSETLQDLILKHSWVVASSQNFCIQDIKYKHLLTPARFTFHLSLINVIPN